MKQFDSIEIYDIVVKLVGKTEPYVDSATDKERFESVKLLAELHERLYNDLNYIARKYKDSPYGSAKVIGEYCDKHLKEFNYENT